MDTMVIRNAAVMSDDRTLRVLDVIPFRNEPFIVAEWIDDKRTGKRRAKRLLRLLTLKFEKSPPGGVADVMVNTMIPAEILSGAAQPAQGGPIQVIEDPKVISAETKRETMN